MGTTIDELKSKKQMTKVRKKAMRHFLSTDEKGNRKPRKSIERSQRLTSVDSNGSRSSVGSQDAAVDISANAEQTIPNNGGRPTSTALSTSSRRPPKTSSPEVRTSSMCVLGPAPIVMPPRSRDEDGNELPYILLQAPLLASLGESMDPFRTMFQTTRNVVSVERMKFLCARFFGTYAMGKWWIPTVLSSPHTFLSTLCCASAHLDAILERTTESLETVALRQEVMHLIDQNIVDPSRQVDDMNLTALLQLIVSEVIARHEIPVKFHAHGIRAMFEQRGGLNQLGVHGYLASTISWTLLESAILSEEKPEEVYLNYCTARSTRNPPYLPTATIPESPIYRPRSHFETLKRSRSCTKQTLDLLEDVNTMTELFLNPTRSHRRDSRTLLSLYQDILSKYPPISRTVGTTQDEYRYEAVRITATLQAGAIMNRLPLSSALGRGAFAVPRNAWFAPASDPGFSPASPTSPMSKSFRNDSVVSSGTFQSYANSLYWSQPTNEYFEVTRPSIASTNTSHPSFSSSGSYPSFSSMETPRSSFSSTVAFHPSKSRPSLTTATSDPWEYNPFHQHHVETKDEPSRLLEDLKKVLDSSNMSECWQDMAGVLLWIGLTMGAASHKIENMVLKKWYSAMSMRASILLCFEHPEAVHATMLKMSQLVGALGSSDVSNVVTVNNEPSRGGSRTTGKRRRV